MKTDGKKLLELLDRIKFPLLALLLGLGILLLPGKTEQAGDPADENQLLEQTLSCTQGVGRARVIVSDNGVVIVCQGADDAQVRLDIIRAVGSYTGLPSDKITVLKMAANEGK